MSIVLALEHMNYSTVISHNHTIQPYNATIFSMTLVCHVYMYNVQIRMVNKAANSTQYHYTRNNPLFKCIDM